MATNDQMKTNHLAEEVKALREQNKLLLDFVEAFEARTLSRFPAKFDQMVRARFQKVRHLVTWGKPEGGGDG